MSRILPFSVLAFTGLATVAAAAPAVGLVGDRTLVMFDTESLAVGGAMDVTGVDSLVGIDLRPADGTLIGVTQANEVVVIDMETGEATVLSTMDVPLPMDGAAVIVDFNPMADRLRYMTGTTNHRVNVDTGEVTVDGSLAYEDADMHAGEAPEIVAAAYINSYGKPESTAMYDIDATIIAVIQQTSPNDGTLAAIGKLGIDASESGYAFDVQTTADMENTAWLVTGTLLSTVDLETGVATEVGTIEDAGGDIRDIAILPES